MLSQLQPFRRSLALLAAHKLALGGGLLCTAAASLLALWFVRLAGRTLDQVVGLAGSTAAPDGAGAELLSACALLALVRLGDVGLRSVAGYAVIDVSRRVEAELKNRLVAHLHRLPLAWFDRARTGDLISRLTQDIAMMRRLFGPTLLQLTAIAVVVPGGLVLMLALSPVLLLGTLVGFVLVLAVAALLMPRVRRQSARVQETVAEVSQRCAEAFAGVDVLMAFDRAGAEADAMADTCERHLASSLRLTRTQALLHVLMGGARHLVMAGVLVLGAAEALAGNVGYGDLFSFLLLTAVMVRPLQVAGATMATFHHAAAAAQRVEQVFAAAPEPDAGAEPELTGRLVVRDLTFAYDGQTRPALERISFTLAPGQKLGIVGPAGAGKSTLLALLTRLYEPPPGTVFVDGFDVRELRPAALRRLFAVAPQDAFLFSDSVRGNVVFGAGHAPEDEEEEEAVRDAVATSALDQDLDDLPEGLASAVGERGVALSGGQRQRVSLARALATDRPALVIDDALSGVDLRTEAVIRERLGRARPGRTSIVATHRLSLVADADLILVLHGGRLIEQGTHQELLAAGGYYARAWDVQRQRDVLTGDEDGP